MRNQFNPAIAAIAIIAGSGAQLQKTVPIIHGPDESKPSVLPSKGKRSRKRRAAKLRAQQRKEQSE